MIQNRIAAVVAIACLWSSGLLGGEPQKLTHKPGLIELRLPTYEPGVDVTWEARQPLDLDFKTYEGGSVIVFYASQPGQLVVTSDVIDWDKKVRDKTSWIVTIEGKAPEPKPDPKPDDPKPPRPDVTPAPIKDPGLRVLIVYESSQLSILPTPQREILFSTVLRAWMTQNCARENNRPEWRIVDQNQPSVADTASMQAMFARPRMAVPWIVISNGTKNTGFEGVLPANYEELQKLLEAHK